MKSYNQLGSLIETAIESGNTKSKQIAILKQNAEDLKKETEAIIEQLQQLKNKLAS